MEYAASRSLTGNRSHLATTSLTTERNDRRLTTSRNELFTFQPFLTITIDKSMNKLINNSEDYSDIPGTYLFDKSAYIRGYALNCFCLSLMKEENRTAFLANEGAYLDRYALTTTQRQAVRDRNWLKMIREGGSICYVSKLGATCGFTAEELAASMSGMTTEEYRKMMLSGGRTIEGNRSKSEQAAVAGSASF